MMPYMAQGAASAIEDAVVLARCLARVSCNEIPIALAVYAANRKERTARMQLTNRENTWLRFRTDTDWVYDFDAWHTELAGLEHDVAVLRRRTSIELAIRGRRPDIDSGKHRLVIHGQVKQPLVFESRRACADSAQSSALVRVHISSARSA
jgi:hypothetical protein